MHNFVLLLILGAAVYLLYKKIDADYKMESLETRRRQALAERSRLQVLEETLLQEAENKKEREALKL